MSHVDLEITLTIKPQKEKAQCFTKIYIFPPTNKLIFIFCTCRSFLHFLCALICETVNQQHSQKSRLFFSCNIDYNSKLAVIYCAVCNCHTATL